MLINYALNCNLINKSITKKPGNNCLARGTMLCYNEVF
jgi:hypothetical protein